ncbi:MAG: OmpH family outer membrane protein [Pseudomonadota bacterium]|nr:OmpH family outer membrane protein [Pseudomonadota bacterium]
MNFYRSVPMAAVIAKAGLSAVPISAAHAADDFVGNPVPGVCLLSREAVFAQAKVGEAARQRLGQLAEQSNTQLDNQRKPIDADVKTFQEKAPSLSEAQRKSQGAALHDRMTAFQAQAGELNQRLQSTRGKAMERIGLQAQPIVAELYKSHHCGLLLNRDAVLSGNMTNDLTDAVVQGLDRKITTISFNLEPLPSGNSGK